MRALAGLGALFLVGSPALAQTPAPRTSQPTGTASSAAGASSSGASALDPPVSSSPAGSSGSSGAASSRSTPARRVPPSRTRGAEQTAASDEDDDEEGAELLWIDGTAGLSYVDVVQFSQDNFIPGVTRTNGTGMCAGLGAGLRFLFLTVGARATVASFPGAHVGTAVFDLGLRIPIPVVQPFARVGFGYAWLGDAGISAPGGSDMSVDGLALEAGLGVDIYLSDAFSIGGGFDAAFLNLSRQKASCATGSCSVDMVNFEEDGDAAGFQLRFAAHAGLHL